MPAACRADEDAGAWPPLPRVPLGSGDVPHPPFELNLEIYHHRLHNQIKRATAAMMAFTTSRKYTTNTMSSRVKAPPGLSTTPWSLYSTLVSILVTGSQCRRSKYCSSQGVSSCILQTVRKPQPPHSLQA